MVVFQIKTYCTAEIRRLISESGRVNSGRLKGENCKMWLCGESPGGGEERLPAAPAAAAAAAGANKFFNVNMRKSKSRGHE